MHSTPLAVDSYLLDDICGRYISNDTFWLGSKELVCTYEDFGRILDFSYRGTKVDIREFTSHHITIASMTRLHGYELSSRVSGLIYNIY